MNRIVLVGFLPCDNGCSCDLHPFGCGNSLVINWDNHGLGMQLHLRMTVPHELARYTINGGETDGCRVCFVAWDVLAAGNVTWLDGVIVCIRTVFTSDYKNHSMRCLFHHNHGYDSGKIVEL